MQNLTVEALAKLSDAEKDEMYRLLTMPPETRYARDPVGWAVEVLGVPEWSLRWSLLPEYADHVWDGTPGPIAAMLEGVARGEDVGVESATGTGKTYGAAIATLWFDATHRDALVVTTAPKEDQLAVQLWKEIGRHWPRFKARYPMASTVKLKVRMQDAEGQDETWGAVGWACGVDANEESATRAQGFHAAHMLVITEETPGVPKPVMEAFANTRTGAHNPQLSLGNPDHMQDSLHLFCELPSTTAIRISGFDHPNVVTGREVIPGAVTAQSLARMKARLGEDTPLYNSRARGICPDQSTNALIRSEWVERAFQNYEDPSYHVGKPAMGVDVAQSEAGDKAAIARGTGAALHEVESFQCTDASVLGERVVIEAQQKGVLGKHVGVDAIGVGSNVVNAGKRLGFPMVAIQSAEMAQPEKDAAMDVEVGMTPVVGVERYQNLRSQMWWQLAQDLQHNRLAMKRNDSLKRDLLAVQWEPKNGRIAVELKMQVRKRLGRSTDEGDAVVYWNWVRDRRSVQAVQGEVNPFSPEALGQMMQVLRTGVGRKGLRTQVRSRMHDEGGY